MASPSKKRLALLWQKLRRAMRLPVGFVVGALLAWVLLWPARVVVLTIPLRHIVRLYGSDHGVNAAIPLVSEAQIKRARTIRDAITLAVRYGPKSANCYPQALVARLFLWSRGVPHALFFGLRRSPEKPQMDAHAWVMAGPLAVTGGYSFDRFTVVRSFLSEPR
jgi:hypothetical protein